MFFKEKGRNFFEGLSVVICIRDDHTNHRSLATPFYALVYNFFLPLDRMIGDILFWVCLSVGLFVCSQTFNLASKF